jgi:hypothetical protein
MKVKFILTFCVVLALVLGCAKPPLAEMDSAKEAVLRAENDENAVLYASSTLARARDSLRRMQTEADSKRYDAAKTHAAEAVAAAEKAIVDGAAGAERAKDESAALLSTLRPLIEEAGRNINGARYSNLNLNFAELNRELNSASDTTDKAEEDHLQGRFQDALEKGRTARSVVSGINERITGAATLSYEKK